MKIAIVGSGLTGLTSAYKLAKNGHQVFIFEKENNLGGLAESFSKKDWEWPLENYYHHFFKTDSQIIALAKELKIESQVFFKKPQTSIFSKNKIFPFSTPFDLLSLPLLNFGDKIRLGTASLFLKLNPFWQPLENISAKKLINFLMGKKVYQIVWEPLLKGKFGGQAENISGAWFWTRINKRSRELGYFKGGFNLLIKSLAQQIDLSGGVFLFNQKVTQVDKQENLFTLFIDQKPFGQKFDQVFLTVSPDTFLKLTKNLSINRSNLEKLKSIGSLCLVLELKKPFLDKTYWLNINDLSFPFVALVDHTNFIEKKYYQDHHLIYIGGYYPINHRFFKMKKETILTVFLPYLKKINPRYKINQNLISFDLFKDQYAQPLIGLGYSKIKPKIKTEVKNLFWASLHHVYPQDRGTNYAIKIALEMVKAAEQ